MTAAGEQLAFDEVDEPRPIWAARSVNFVLGRYLSEAAARAHCEHELRQQSPLGRLVWRPQPGEPIAYLHRLDGGDGHDGQTGWNVTESTVHTAFPQRPR